MKWTNYRYSNEVKHVPFRAIAANFWEILAVCGQKHPILRVLIGSVRPSRRPLQNKSGGTTPGSADWSPSTSFPRTPGMSPKFFKNAIASHYGGITRE
jgi:hypothetical protein